MNEIINPESLPAVQEARRPAIVAGHRPTAIVPTSMDECWRLAKAVCAADLAPRGLNTPEKAMIAIMTGLEVGMTPMASLRRICVINNQPTIWGDGALGLVRASGICLFVKEWIQGQGDARVAFCETHRKGEPSPIRRQFSVADAKTSGLWTKKGRDGQSTPWQQYPERMLQMRARAFALRDGYADILGGMYIAEELEDASVSRTTSPIEAPPEPEIEPELPQTADALPAANTGDTSLTSGVNQDDAHAVTPTSSRAERADRIASDTPRAVAGSGRLPPYDPGPLPPILDRRVKKSDPAPTRPSTDDPEAYIKWVDGMLGAVQPGDGKDIQSWFNDQIAPTLSDLFPPDQEEVLAVYRKHEARLAP